jgi:adenosylcobinamide amidohydrolase
MKKYVLLLLLWCFVGIVPCYASEQQELYTLSTGDLVFRQDDSVGILFREPRSVISTSIINGGYREDLTGVFNHTITGNIGMTVESYVEYMRQETRKLGLNPDKVSSMGTGAAMDNAVITTETFHNAVVTAIVTAGVEGNAGRAGDPTDYFKAGKKALMPKPGTINIVLILDADMPAGTLARALVTCTEAKTAALQELMVGSRYSNGLATGSGTDQTIIIANPQSELYLDDTGKHSKLGELIGRVVKSSVKEALLKQNGLSGTKQHSVIRRMERFGITPGKLYQDYINAGYTFLSKEDFLRRYDSIDRDDPFVTKASLYVHLLDQYVWGLLSAEEVRETGNELIAGISRQRNVPVRKIEATGLPEFVGVWEELLLGCVRQSVSQQN